MTDELSVAYVGVDLSKDKLAIAVTDGAPGGDVVSWHDSLALAGRGVSFGLCLIHMPVIWLVERLGLPMAPRAPDSPPFWRCPSFWPGLHATLSRCRHSPPSGHAR